MTEAKMTSVLFVCLGNICRSPTAHGVFEALLEQRGLSHAVSVESCGTGDWHVGSAPDRRATAEARERGYAIEQIIDWMATRPARFAGLGQRKGRIAVGYDADFCVFDDTAQYVIEVDMIKYRHKVTPYEGRRVSGIVRRTFVRGHEVFADGEILSTPLGQPLLRAQ